MTKGRIVRIDVHSHLLPGADDGCSNLEESLECARRLVEAGYTHSFCTPHIWPNLPQNTVEQIVKKTARLQQSLDAASIPLRLLPGGELNLRPDTDGTPIEHLPTYAMAGRWCLFDIWADRIPPFFWKAIRWLQSLGLKAIVAHPERMRAVQDEPMLVDEFLAAGLLLQGNLQCLGDPPGSMTRTCAERFLMDGKYFVLGSDLHNLAGLKIRLDGLARAIKLVGESEVWTITHDNPLQLLPQTPSSI